jgi:hypothetical protein
MTPRSQQNAAYQLAVVENHHKRNDHHTRRAGVESATRAAAERTGAGGAAQSLRQDANGITANCMTQSYSPPLPEPAYIKGCTELVRIAAALTWSQPRRTDTAQAPKTHNPTRQANLGGVVCSLDDSTTLIVSQGKEKAQSSCAPMAKPSTSVYNRIADSVPQSTDTAQAAGGWERAHVAGGRGRWATR